jgi:hypothetical protein
MEVLKNLNTLLGGSIVSDLPLDQKEIFALRIERRQSIKKLPIRVGLYGKFYFGGLTSTPGSQGPPPHEKGYLL